MKIFLLYMLISINCFSKEKFIEKIVVPSFAADKECKEFHNYVNSCVHKTCVVTRILRNQSIDSFYEVVSKNKANCMIRFMHRPTKVGIKKFTDYYECDLSNLLARHLANNLKVSLSGDAFTAQHSVCLDGPLSENAKRIGSCLINIGNFTFLDATKFAISMKKCRYVKN